MFGIKKLQVEIKDLSARCEAMHLLMINHNMNGDADILKRFDEQKIDLSVIKTRFHDLGEKFDKNQKDFSSITRYLSDQHKMNEALSDKIFIENAMLQHIKELNEKLTFLFDYMRQLEKLLGNVELIVDQCLPELTLKLPKKKKAITRAS